MTIQKLFTREVGGLIIAGVLVSGCSGISGLTKQEGQAGGATIGGAVGTSL